jgi:hypothetical protein
MAQWRGGKSFKGGPSTRLQLRGSAGFAPASLHRSANGAVRAISRLEKNLPEFLESRI